MQARIDLARTVGLAALTLAASLAHAKDSGRTPQRIVTMSPSLTDSVCALGHC